MPAPDDIYKGDVDFTTLALQYPDFSKRLKANRQLDFSDPESVRQLTKCLLHRDFDLRIDLPEDRLCPPVPNRFNYVLFIQRLLDSTSPDFHEGYDPERDVMGLDIGTGSSAIYPLLACRQRPQWRFLATEIDEKNREYAEKNIATNGLQSRIKVIDTDTEGKTLIPSAFIERFDRIDILMTNPPFYESRSSLLESAGTKSRPANSSCTGAEVEMITPGGEIAFVTKLVHESAQDLTRHKIQWFSAMLGKLSSVSAVVEELRKRGCVNHAVTEFVQGPKTRRWCVAWSWMSLRPSNAVARGVGAMSGVERRLLPAMTEVELAGAVDADGNGNEDAVAKRVSEEIDELDLMWRFDARTRVGILVSRRGDVWSRKARRKNHKFERRMGPRRARKKANDHNAQHGNQDLDEEMRDQDRDPADADADQDPEDYDSEDDEDAELCLVARVSILSSPHSNSNDEKVPTTTTTTIHIRHLQGPEAVVFESLTGWLKRKVCTAPRPADSSTSAAASASIPGAGTGAGAGASGGRGPRKSQRTRG